MNRIQHLSQNATANSVELMDVISNNIYGYSMNGHRAKRYSFSDFMNGGEIHDNGYRWSQGKQEPRIGEWTKMMLQGRGFFSVIDTRNQRTLYTRLGDFHLDAEGNLVTSDGGYKLQGIPLTGAFTALRGPLPGNPDFDRVNPNVVDPFYNPYTNNAQQLNKPGAPVGNIGDINLALSPENGRYLGHFTELKIGEDGVIYGKDGNNLVSLYKIHVVDFNNPDGLVDIKDGIYFKATAKSGMPCPGVNETMVVSEALEKSNSWIKVEAHNLTDAQRYFQASTQIHKLADKISGTAIEMIQ